MLSPELISALPDRTPRGARIAANPKKYFFKATIRGDAYLLKQLLDNSRFNWATRDEFGASALHHAAFNGHVTCLKLLLENNQAEVVIDLSLLRKSFD